MFWTSWVHSGRDMPTTDGNKLCLVKIRDWKEWHIIRFERGRWWFGGELFDSLSPNEYIIVRWHDLPEEV